MTTKIVHVSIELSNDGYDGEGLNFPDVHERLCKVLHERDIASLDTLSGYVTGVKTNEVSERINSIDCTLNNRDSGETWLGLPGGQVVEVRPIDLMRNMIENLPEDIVEATMNMFDTFLKESGLETVGADLESGLN